MELPRRIVSNKPLCFLPSVRGSPHSITPSLLLVVARNLSGCPVVQLSFVSTTKLTSQRANHLPPRCPTNVPWILTSRCSTSSIVVTARTIGAWPSISTPRWRKPWGPSTREWSSSWGSMTQGCQKSDPSRLRSRPTPLTTQSPGKGSGRA